MKHAFSKQNMDENGDLAITKDNVDAPPTLFATYDSSIAFESCTVWPVARATSAAIGFFESIRLWSR
ncbi:hypothetical protein VTN49DRAFT_7888 [Thermomyces lanuginosus]|uniref:uncharacterized protein n=1 Tax=Thermomyces lanuginosus TaxID=5541 RepID=UPI0037435C97